MADNKEYFVTVDTACGGYYLSWAETCQVTEPDEPSEVHIETREEYLEHQSYLDDHVDWVITFEQPNGAFNSSQVQLLLCDDTLRKLVDFAGPRLRATPIERDPEIEHQLEEEYAECDG